MLALRCAHGWRDNLCGISARSRRIHKTINLNHRHASAVIARKRTRREVDPIEANALHGGRMSLTGSIMVAGKTVWSSGVGASVGLEAGYTQLASGLASQLRQSLQLRRSDLRILVGCGRRRDRGRLWCSARRRFLCVRARHRQLLRRQPRPRVDRRRHGANSSHQFATRSSRHRCLGVARHRPRSGRRRRSRRARALVGIALMRGRCARPR